jgi:TPR repeat protein
MTRLPSLRTLHGWALSGLLFTCPPLWAEPPLPPIHAQTLKRAQQGDAESQTMMGLMLLDGKVMPQNAKQARQWLTKAAQQNHTPAQFYLGQLLMADILEAKNKELTQQLSEGLVWLQRAALAQHPEAQLLYAKVVLESNQPDLFGHDKAQAESLLLECASKHLPCTRFALARQDRLGLNTNDLTRSLLQTLAQHNDTQAMLRLSSFPQENRTAWIRKAAYQNDPQACYLLAQLILNGKEPVQDSDPSVLQLLNNSAKQGQVESMFLLAQLLYEGQRFPVNRPLAREWLEKAADKGYEPAVRLLKGLKKKGE